MGAPTPLRTLCRHALAHVPDPAATPPLRLTFKPPLPALGVAGSPPHLAEVAWVVAVKARRAKSAHASAEVLHTVAPPSFGGALAPPFRTVVSSFPASQSVVPWPVVSWSVVSWADGYAAGSNRNLGKGRGRSEEKGGSSHGCKGMGPHGTSPKRH